MVFCPSFTLVFPRHRGVRSSEVGFTLIELIVVIVILGILAATALPKLVDMGTDARAAAVASLQGALVSAAELGHTKCLTSSTCNPGLGYNASPTPLVTLNGTSENFHYGYPTAWGYPSTASSNGGIWDWLSISGFTKKSYTGGSYVAIFTKDGAPDPTNCSVQYSLLSLAPGVTLL